MVLKSLQPMLMLNPIQPYAWGKVDGLVGLGAEPTGKPQAELWMGAHPSAPSVVCVDGKDVTLDQLIAENPDSTIGEQAFNRFGGLPFLFKTLAVGAPLSIQAHPNLEQAIQGFADEDSRGVPIGASNRTYRDPNHKPELFVAVTDFWALIGFRESTEIKELLSPIGSDKLNQLSSLLDGEDGLKKFTLALMNLDQKDKDAIIQKAVAYTRTHLTSSENTWVNNLHREYPNDIWVLAPLILNLKHFNRGDSVALEAGVVHAYLSGTIVEIMANSDNVIRVGLTPKHKDIAQLSKVGVFKPTHIRMMFQDDDETIGVYSAHGIDEFELVYAPFDGCSPAKIAVNSAQILYMLEGSATLRWNDGEKMQSLKINQGESYFIPICTGEYTLEGAGTAFIAMTPKASLSGKKQSKGTPRIKNKKAKTPTTQPNSSSASAFGAPQVVWRQ